MYICYGETYKKGYLEGLLYLGLSTKMADNYGEVLFFWICFCTFVSMKHTRDMKILNLYAGIGGNRKLWGDGHKVTAVENRRDIATIYKDYFPKDELLVMDAHEYLIRHYKEFDFIWSSPPCPTHSNARYWSSKGGMYDVEYPDMKLYQEILLLKYFFSGKWVVENVKPYYEPLIGPTAEIGRHLFWSNFTLPRLRIESNYIWNGDDMGRVTKLLGFNLEEYRLSDKTKILRNCVVPEVGKAILNRAMGIIKEEGAIQTDLFSQTKFINSK